MMFLLRIFILSTVFLVSCEEEYTPEDVFDQPKIVVEGYIEHGDGALPPYVILTKSSPYLASFSEEQLNDLFIHNADAKVIHQEDTLLLTEICLNDVLALDSALATTIAQSIGLGGVDLGDVNYCVYVDVLGFLGQSSIVPQEGETYQLEITVNDDTIRSITTIPYHVDYDSLFVINHPAYPTNDSLVELRAQLTDPAGDNYYRLFTKRNSEPFYPLVGGSVTDDKIFDGRVFVFPIQRAEPTNTSNEIDINTFGYFWRADTITIRAISLDYRHFRFWQTLEYNSGSQGPFSSYVRIESNIDGGLGIWGGQSFKDYQLIVPE